MQPDWRLYSLGPEMTIWELRGRAHLPVAAATRSAVRATLVPRTIRLLETSATRRITARLRLSAGVERMLLAPLGAARSLIASHAEQRKLQQPPRAPSRAK